MELLLGVVALALWVFCLVDAIGSPADRIRNLPKVAWVLLILFFPLVGSIAWLVAGRPDGGVARRSAYERAQPAFPEYDRPGRAAAVDPDRDEEFLRQVRERAEAQRRAYDERRKRERGQDDTAGA
ncbi:MAG TPA: PLD nuclease N-terminal domain-containing protein [Nocardioides sp.]|nr:PLD nuclease N-terminal domain-containing protein [Nocardioides sp.]